MQFKTYLIFSLVIILAMILSACGSSQNTVRDSGSSPCNDSLFLVLKKKDYESLSYDEKSYFNKVREECKNEILEKSGKSTTDVTGLIIIGTAVVLLLTYVALAMGAKSH
jgi:predicted small secreted protein